MNLYFVDISFFSRADDLIFLPNLRMHDLVLLFSTISFDVCSGLALCTSCRLGLLFMPSYVALNYMLPMQVKFREFIPSILHVSRQCLASGEEDVAVIAFEIFDELIESPAPLLGESVKSIVQFSLEVCSSQNLESSTRHQVGRSVKYIFLFSVL
jgi:hypothetical protein